MIRASFHTLVGGIALLLLLTAGSPAMAQEPAVVTDPYVEFGLVPAALMTLPLGTLESIRGSDPCSRTFAATTNVNPSYAIRGGYVIDGDLLTPGFRLRAFHLTIGYDNLSSRFESSPGERYEAYDPINGAYGMVETMHTAEYQLDYLRAAADLDLALGGNMILRGGVSFSAPLTGSSRESERIMAPENATFLDRTQELTIAEGTGELSGLGVRFGAGASFVYRLPLGRKLYFEPNIGVDLGITPVQPSWTPLLVRGGINIGYGFITDPIVIAPPVVELDTVPVEEILTTPPRPPFTAKSNIDVAAEKLPVEFRRQIVARYVPVLPTIFFAPNTATLPERYVRLAPPGRAPRGGERDIFDESLVPPNAEQAHYRTLDIFGRRLRENPRAKVTVTGTTSRDEEGRAGLARMRAETVAEYWATTWGIERERITVRSRIDPSLPSNAEYAEGREENRRVELDFSDDDIYRSVQLRSVEPITEPREIPFSISATSPFNIERWRVEITVGKGQPEMIEGPGAPSGLVNWKLAALDRERVLRTGSVSYVLTIYDGEGRSLSTLPKFLPLRLDTTITVATSADLPVNTAEFLLVTFDFDRADLTRRGRQELETILARIGPSSEVSIVGYTDPVGEVERNRELALARAQKVAALMPKDAKVEVRGAAPDEAPYSSTSPEGRFLSRTVRVVVRNPK